jgi:uncharacterized membrane protein
MITLYSVSIVLILLTIVCLEYRRVTNKLNKFKQSSNSIDTTIVYTNKKQKKSDKVKNFVQKPTDDAFIDAIDVVADLEDDIPDNYVEINQHG